MSFPLKKKIIAGAGDIAVEILKNSMTRHRLRGNFTFAHVGVITRNGPIEARRWLWKMRVHPKRTKRS